MLSYCVKKGFELMALFFQIISGVADCIDTFFFQFVNPKGVMAAITLVSRFEREEDYINSSIAVILVCSITAFLSIITWAFFGKFLRKFATNDNFIKNFNYSMSALIVICIIGFYI